MYNNQNGNNNGFQNNRPQETIFERTVDGRIIPVRDGEAIVFEIALEPFKIICIANVPEEGKTTAPVYLKYKMSDGRSPNGFRRRFPRDPNAPQVDYVRGDYKKSGYRPSDDDQDHDSTND